MGRFLFKRAVQGLISLWILATIVFILARAVGNPVDLMLSPDATEADRVYMIHQLGLDRPVTTQYWEFISGAVHGDLGQSIRFKRSAASLFFERMPNSLKLLGVGFILSAIVALPLGVISGSNRNSPADNFIKIWVVIGIAAPNFFIALVLIQVFSVNLGWLPSARMGGWDHYVLPAISLTFFTIAGITRLLRSSIIETIDTEFVKLARIKGVSRRVVIWKHCLRNALIPAMTFMGMNVSHMVGGAIVVESIFAWPGTGRLAYEGIVYRDYPLIQACVLITGVFIVLVNLAVDVAYSYVDPRIRRD